MVAPFFTYSCNTTWFNYLFKLLVIILVTFLHILIQIWTNFCITTKSSHLITLLKYASWTKNYDQDLKKNVESEIEVNHLFIRTKISATKHKQHSKIHFKFKPWDGRQMVNIESLILYFGFKSRLKCNKTNTNEVCSFKYILN